MKFLIVIFIAILPILTFGQSKNKGTFKVRKVKKSTRSEGQLQEFIESEISWINSDTIIVINASFPGENDALNKFIDNNMRYPQKEKNNNITGKIMVRFLIRKNGNITNVKITKGINKNLKKEALRIVRSMPRWNPSQVNGTNKKSYQSIPIEFSLK